MKQKNCKRDEDNRQKHQKQGTFLRKPKKTNFYGAKNITNREPRI